MQAALTSEDQSPFQRFQAKILASRFLTISLLLHVILVLLFGGVVLIHKVTEPPDFVSEGNFVEVTTDKNAPPADSGDSMPEFSAPDMQPAGGAPDIASISAITANTVVSNFKVDVAPQVPNNLATVLSKSVGTTVGVAALSGAGGSGGGTGTGIGSGSGRGHSIGGMMVKAQKLAVALDTSGSVKAYRDEMQEYVKKTFPGSPVEEFKAMAGFNPDSGKGRSMGSIVVEFLQSPKNFDAIYIFSDFGETRGPQALWDQVKNLVQTKKVRLYLHVLREKGKEKKISPELEEAITLAKHSGGNVKIGPMTIKEESAE